MVCQRLQIPKYSFFLFTVSKTTTTTKKKKSNSLFFWFSTVLASVGWSARALAHGGALLFAPGWGPLCPWLARSPRAAFCDMTGRVLFDVLGDPVSDALSPIPATACCLSRLKGSVRSQVREGDGAAQRGSSDRRGAAGLCLAVRGHQSPQPPLVGSLSLLCRYINLVRPDQSCHPSGLGSLLYKTVLVLFCVSLRRQRLWICLAYWFIFCV
ncbi:hypothetical protein BD289DRAFT_191479 [Coniella lustricola]|uniref:Uncharacterized protein n=1 Tax=Coniella lustricola TaxID=2025994 RepID=A0A2T3ALZ5_9PEZI|nr:hypothetical protein BD289DRAFT_191479 [Coniella lustricola]